MAWVKRNLFWVIGGVVALGLLGGAFFYLYTNIQSEKEIDEQLKQKLARWDELKKAGNDSRDAIEAAKEEEKKLQAFLGETRKFFTPIPYPPVRDNRDFRFLLDTTLNMLERLAESSAVTLPPKPFVFTFKPQSESVQFETPQLQPLTMQLAEIATISQILFKAKIHSLEGVRRVPITKDDIGSTDYLDRKAVTNTIGNLLEIHLPYEFTFRCFSAELAQVIDGLARSPHCLLVKSLNTETTTPVSATQPAGLQPGMPFHDPFRSSYLSGGLPGGAGSAAADRMRMMMRYGGRYGPMAPQPETPVAPTTAPQPRAGPVTILDEKPLRITMTVEAVRLIEATAAVKAKASK